MNRREALQKTLMTVAGAGLGLGVTSARAMTSTDKLFVFVQAEGGWDPTSFCDPKTNQPGEPLINNWAESADVQQAGNIPYAPFANNAAFFNKYFSRMLVINGVDAQTNAHSVGVVHNWSGRNSDGFPSMGALLAAQYSPDTAMPYISNGGFGRTQGLTRFTRLDDAHVVRNIATPEKSGFDPSRSYYDAADWDALQRHRDISTNAQLQQPGLMPRAARNRALYASSMAASGGLLPFASLIPDDGQLQPRVEVSGVNSSLRRQAQLAVLAFKSQIAVSADLHLSGFDTHQQHDSMHGPLLAHLTDAIDYLWDYAEEQSIADRLVVVMGSDFGRTNFYNSDLGKDHWPIGSFVIMEKNKPWTNRVVAGTDERHEAYRVNPISLTRDDANGTIIYPKHIHKALRRYFGLETTPGALRFPLNNTEDFDFFS